MNPRPHEKTRPLWAGQLFLDRGLGARQVHRRASRANTEYMAKANHRKTLNEYRRDKALTVREMAEKSGISELQVRNYLYRNREPLIGAALRLCEALGVQPGEVDWTLITPDTRKVPDLSTLPPMPPGPISEDQLSVAKAWIAAGVSKTEVAKTMGVSRQTLYSYLD